MSGRRGRGAGSGGQGLEWFKESWSRRGHPRPLPGASLLDRWAVEASLHLWVPGQAGPARGWQGCVRLGAWWQRAVFGGHAHRSLPLS